MIRAFYWRSLDDTKRTETWSIYYREYLIVCLLMMAEHCKQLFSYYSTLIIHSGDLSMSIKGTIDDDCDDDDGGEDGGDDDDDDNYDDIDQILWHCVQI